MWNNPVLRLVTTEQTRWAYLTRSGFSICPTGKELFIHMINPLLTKLVRSISAECWHRSSIRPVKSALVFSAFCVSDESLGLGNFPYPTFLASRWSPVSDFQMLEMSLWWFNIFVQDLPINNVLPWLLVLLLNWVSLWFHEGLEFFIKDIMINCRFQTSTPNIFRVWYWFVLKILRSAFVFEDIPKTWWCGCICFEGNPSSIHPSK